MILSLYRFLTRLSAPAVRFYLQQRVKNGKEDPNRLKEREGIASEKAEQYRTSTGSSLPTIWFHGASVGEALSLLPIVDRLTTLPVRIVFTSGTLTSARLLEKRLPEGRVIHQFMPLDVPQWVDRFLDYWQPSFGVLVESELWPNMLQACKNRCIPLILANARLSIRSFRRWSKTPKTARALLSCLSICLAPSTDHARRYRMLGAMNVRSAGHLKFAATPLTFNAAEAALWQEYPRPVWAAVSTHPGEEEQIAAAIHLLKLTIPDLLTIIIPRHTQRAPDIQKMLENKDLRVQSRAQNPGLPALTTDVYIADTMGETGLFYHISPISFVGGTLAPVGGHNPIEPVKLGSLPIWGPHHQNAADIAAIFEGLIPVVTCPEMLAQTVSLYLTDRQKRVDLLTKLTHIDTQQSGALQDLEDAMGFFLPAFLRKESSSC